MSDVMSRLTLCSKSEQQGCCLPWLHPETVDCPLETLTCMNVSLVLITYKTICCVIKDFFPISKV